MSELPQEAVEAAVNATGRRNNPKWDHPITGYQTFSDDQKEYLRGYVQTALSAASPYLAAQTLRDAADALDLQPPKLRAQYVATLRLYADEPWRLRDRADRIEAS
jgi:hypothetical protein